MVFSRLFASAMAGMFGKPWGGGVPPSHLETVRVRKILGFVDQQKVGNWGEIVEKSLSFLWKEICSFLELFWTCLTWKTPKRPRMCNMSKNQVKKFFAHFPKHSAQRRKKIFCYFWNQSSRPPRGGSPLSAVAPTNHDKLMGLFKT